MIRLVAFLWFLTATISFGANPDYRAFRGSGGVLVTTNPPTGLIIIDGSGVFTSSGTNATIAVSTNGVLVAVASTNINFVTGSNVFLAATNIGSRTHIGINAFTPVPFIEGAVTNLLLTWILPILTVDSLTVSNLLAAPPLSSVQYNSNGVTRGSAGFIYTNGQVRVADIVVAGQGVEVTSGSFVLNGGDTALVAWNGLGRMRWPTGGVARLEDDSALSFNRLQLGGDTAAFPAIGRTNGDVIILGANGNFKLGGSTNRLIAPAVHIANDGGVGTPLLSLDNPLSAIRWDLAIDSNPQTYFLGLGRVGDATPTMVWEIGGNVGINTTNPATTLDVNGRTFLRSNVWMSAIPSNATPVAFLATDSGGEVYETAIPTVAASAETNAVLTNIIGTVAGNVTNVVSLSTTNATSKPLTNSYANGVLTLFGVEAGANVTITPNGSNLVIAATGGGGTPGGNSGAIQFNEGGAFAGTNHLIWDRTNRVMRLDGHLLFPTDNTYDIGALGATRPRSLYAGTSVRVGPSGIFGGDYIFLGGAFVYNNGDGRLTLYNAALDNFNRLNLGGATAVFPAIGRTNGDLIILGANGAFGDGTATNKLRVSGGYIGSNVMQLQHLTGDRIAVLNSSSQVTNGTATASIVNNFFAMGITNIIAADTGIVIRTNNGSLTISNTVTAGGGGMTVSGSTGQIAFINVAGTGLTNANGAELGAVNRPGFGYFPQGPHGGYGGLMVFANHPMGLLTVGHPNAGSDFETFATALVVSNRHAGAGDYKNDMVKFDTVQVGSGLRSDSTLSRWRVWQGTTSSNDVAEINLNGQMKLYGGTLYRSNTVALPTAAELGAGGYWVGVSNNVNANTLVAMWSVDGVTASIKVLSP